MSITEFFRFLGPFKLYELRHHTESGPCCRCRRTIDVGETAYIDRRERTLCATCVAKPRVVRQVTAT